MKVNNDCIELIVKFYEKNKDELDGLTLQQVKDICITPFKLLHLVVSDINIDVSLRFMHLGTFTRNKVWVGRKIKATKTTLAKDDISQETREMLEEMLPMLEAAYERLHYKTYHKKVRSLKYRKWKRQNTSEDIE